MQKILIIEDDTDINNMVKEFLEGQGYSCTQAFSGSEALLRFEMESYDLILLDLMLPGKSGEELLPHFSGKLPVIVISAKNEVDTKVDVLSGGANDYLCKPFDLKELLVRIQVQLRSSSVGGNDDTIHYKDWKLNLSTRELYAGEVLIDLTQHEFEILELLVRNPKRVFSKQSIYEYAWNDEYFVADKTINVHISNIRAKLKKSGTDSYIQTVWGIGFKLS